MKGNELDAIHLQSWFSGETYNCTYTCMPIQFNLRQWPKDKGTPSTSRNLQKANRPSIEKLFSKATMEWRIGDVADRIGWAIVSQGCFKGVQLWYVEFSDPRGKTKAAKPGKSRFVVNVLINSICWMWISCDSQEHHWISTTTTTPMWDQLGRPRIQKQPATVTTYQDEP